MRIVILIAMVLVSQFAFSANVDVRCGYKKELAITSYEKLEKGAVDGDSRSQFLLAYALRLGYFGNSDTEKSLFWLRESAESGDTDAQLHVAKSYEYSKNYPEAYRWYGRAAVSHNPFAYYMLGVYRVSIDFNMVDLTESTKYFKKAAELGFAAANTQLGISYLYAVGVNRNVKLGLAKLHLAAEGGDPEGFRFLSQIYEEGVFVEKDVALAKKYNQKFKSSLARRKSNECHFR